MNERNVDVVTHRKKCFAFWKSFAFIISSMKEAWLPLVIAIESFATNRFFACSDQSSSEIRLKNQGQINNKLDSIIFAAFFFSAHVFLIFYFISFSHQRSVSFSFRRILNQLSCSFFGSIHVISRKFGSGKKAKHSSVSGYQIKCQTCASSTQPKTQTHTKFNKNR